MYRMKKTVFASLLMMLGLIAQVPRAAAQGTVKLEINMGQERPRVAAADFKAATADPQSAPLNTVFNQTLWNDLDNAGIFEMVAKSFYPSSQQPGQPGELNAKAWSAAPANPFRPTLGSSYGRRSPPFFEAGTATAHGRIGTTRASRTILARR